MLALIDRKGAPVGQHAEIDKLTKKISLDEEVELTDQSDVDSLDDNVFRDHTPELSV